MLDDKSWLEVEIKETVTLLRKKLEEINETRTSSVTDSTLCNLKNIYKTLYYIKALKETSK